MDILERMNQENKAEGGFVFVSHSHEDIAEVRKLRNALEQAGFEPLCFYLKCMDKCMEDPALQAELKSLLRREIDAREWFVYVNSRHSRNSSWVQYERECVAKAGTKKVYQMNLEEQDSVEQMAKKILKNLRIFMSYAHKDTPIAHRIKQKLMEKDYRVFLAEDITAGCEWVATIASTILEAAKSGCVLALLTENSVKSPSVMREIEFAIEKGGNVIPVLLGEVILPDKLGFLLWKRQMYQLPADPSDTELEEMVQWLGQNIANEKSKIKKKKEKC